MENTELSRYIYQNTHHIIEKWIECVRKSIPAAKGKSDFLIENHLELFLRNFAVALEHPDWKSLDLKNLDIGKKHGKQRAYIGGYSLDQVIYEYHLFRTTMFDYLQDLQLTRQQVNLLNEYIDEAIRKAVTSFESDVAVLDQEWKIENSLVNATEDLMWIFDRKLRFVMVNQALLKFSGKNEDSILQKTPGELFNSTEVAQELENNARKAFQGEVVKASISLQINGGEVVHTHYIMSPVMDETEDIQFIAVVSRDVSAEKKVLDELRNAIKARDDFMSLISHELNTPLTSLMLQAQNFGRVLSRNLSNEDIQERTKAFSELVLNQTKRLSSLIEDMLDVDRLSSKNIQLNKEHFSLNDLIKEITKRMEPEFDEPPHLSLGSEAEGFWDKRRIEQVLLNILTNALKYGGKHFIEVKSYTHDKDVYLEITDQGKGIKKENQEKIFDKYDRGEVEASDIKGLGLGLFISRQIVSMHGGKIWVESEVGKGTTFKVILPKYNFKFDIS